MDPISNAISLSMPVFQPSMGDLAGGPAVHAPASVSPAQAIQVQALQTENSEIHNAQSAKDLANAAEQRRYEAVQQAAHDIANLYVLGDKRFTIYKDASGQYITRYTSLRDGRVTYIPEPELLGHARITEPPVMKLEA